MVRIHKCGFLTFPPSVTVGPLGGRRHVLLWADEGSLGITLDGEAIHLTSDIVILYSPGSEIVYRSDASANRLGYVFFETDEPMTWPRVRRLPATDILPPLLRHVLWLQLERPSSWERSLGLVLDYILSLLASGASGTDLEGRPHLPAAIADVMAYVAELWRYRDMESPSLGTLAASARVSPEHLCRIFTRELGVPPLAALRVLRLNRAATLLRETVMPISAVSRLCGFANQYHFSAAFKSYSGHSPTEFRAADDVAVPLPAGMRSAARYLYGEQVESRMGDRPAD